MQNLTQRKREEFINNFFSKNLGLYDIIKSNSIFITNLPLLYFAILTIILSNLENNNFKNNLYILIISLKCFHKYILKF